jgi:hypothetical protein
VTEERVGKETWEGYRESYNEPLLFLKHQDDKINRVLTALAFLTAAGVTLYIFSRSHDGPNFPKFSNAYVTADDYFFGCFLLGLFFSVSLSVIALDPTSFTPRFFDDPQEPTSVLFYRSIAAWTKEAWEEIPTDTVEPFEKRLAESFHKDARRLSVRAIHKVRRFGQANAFVQFTIASLALLGVMRLNHVHIEDRWIVATALVIVYTLMPAIDFVYFRALNFPGIGRDYSKTASTIWVKAILFYGPYFALSTVWLCRDHRDWQPFTYALFGTVLLRLIALFEWPGKRPWLGALAAASLLVAWGVVWLLALS